MTRSFISMMAIVFATILGISGLHAEGPWDFKHELLLMKLNTTHGASADNVFEHDTANRFALSYKFCSNVGARISYFNFDEAGTFPAAGPRLISLDIDNTDFELFKQFNLSQKTMLEASAGLRRTDAQVFFPSVNEPNHFEGLGGFVAFRGITETFTGGDLYARGKLALLTGDGVHDGNAIGPAQRFDQSRTHTEIGFGYQHPMEISRFTLTPSFGAEWINLSNYLIDPVDEHPEADMLLSGLAFGLNINF